MKYNIVRNKDKASQLIGGTTRKDHLIGWSYKQLVQAFGNPTFEEVSGEGKVQKQWVFEGSELKKFNLIARETTHLDEFKRN